MTLLKKCTYWLTVVCVASRWTLNFLFSLDGFWQQNLSPLSNLSQDLQPKIYLQTCIVSLLVLYHAWIIYCLAQVCVFFVISVTFFYHDVKTFSAFRCLPMFVTAIHVHGNSLSALQKKKIQIAMSLIAWLFLVRRTGQLCEIISFFLWKFQDVVLNHMM